MPENIIRVGVVVIVERAGRFLLGQRLNTAGHGEWGLPGGHLEYGESLAAGAGRELLEETGLVGNELSLINITNDPRLDDRHYIHFVFAAPNATGEPHITEPDKCAGWQWFSWDDLPRPIFHGHRKLLNALREKRLLSD